LSAPHPDRPLLFLDYDGTLAPIVDDPAAARPHPDVPDLVRSLASAYPLYVVTGRDLAALHRLLGVEVDAIGLHGAERGRLGGPVESGLPDAARDALDERKARVPEVDGVVVEEKGASFAVHYRQAITAGREKEAREALKTWTADLPDTLDAVWGKAVVELRPRGITKGTAVDEIARQHPDRTPLYLGDDTTDEDAFRALHALHDDAVTVKVGAGETAARYRLDDVEAVVRYLEAFR
jgi:trehalose 6-phosphate phosphatase